MCRFAGGHSILRGSGYEHVVDLGEVDVVGVEPNVWVALVALKCGGSVKVVALCSGVNYGAVVALFFGIEVANGVGGDGAEFGVQVACKYYRSVGLFT